MTVTVRASTARLERARLGDSGSDLRLSHSGLSRPPGGPGSESPQALPGEPLGCGARPPRL